MIRYLAFVVAGAMLATAADPCFGHFLFIRVEPGVGDAAPQAHVFFSEQATAGDPRFVDKIAQTKLWQAAAEGPFKPLVVNKSSDRLTAAIAGGGPGVVVGFCEYGVLTREVPFLLRYYPKAIIGKPEEARPHPRRDLQAPEIMASFTADTVTLILVRNGKPLPHVVFTTVDDDLNNEEIKADASGQATFRPKSPGYYCVYTKLVTKQAGEADGKAYEEIREFPTLAFPWKR
jgi:hypothetical protein